ncbi:MAG: hypothetical protein WBM44_31300, partial [Waterburya sp.]
YFAVIRVEFLATRCFSHTILQSDYSDNNILEDQFSIYSKILSFHRFNCSDTMINRPWSRGAIA